MLAMSTEPLLNISVHDKHQGLAYIIIGCFT